MTTSTSTLRTFLHREQHDALAGAVDAAQDAGRAIPCRTYTGPRSPWLAEHSQEQRRAADLCAPCPALADCAAYALAIREAAGTWGGMTVQDRGRHRGRVAA